MMSNKNWKMVSCLIRSDTIKVPLWDLALCTGQTVNGVSLVQ